MGVCRYMKRFLLRVALGLLCGLTAASSLLAQPVRPGGTIRIRGYVADSATEMPLAGVTIELSAPGSAERLAAFVSDSTGAFPPANIRRLPQYEVHVNSTGYRSRSFLFKTPDDSVAHLGRLLLASRSIMLEEVRVKEQRPLVDMGADKITYHVDADPEGATGTAFDILRKVPFLSLDAEDNLRLGASGDFRVLVNGRPSSLFVRNKNDVFKNFPAHSIKSIEILLTPRLRYETQGASGIINIITYEKVRGGINGGLTLRAGTPESYSGSGNITHSAENLDLSADLGASSTTVPAGHSDLLRIDRKSGDRLEQRTEASSRAQSWSFGTEFVFRMDEQNDITLAQNLNKTTGRNFDGLQANLLPVSGAATNYGNRNESRNEASGNDVSVEYSHRSAQDPAKQLQVSGRWIRNGNQDNSRLLGLSSGTENGSERASANQDRYNEWSGQADYQHPFGMHIAEAGISGTYRDNSSQASYLFRDSANGPLLADYGQATDFRYSERVYGAYLSLRLLLGKWSLRLGSRVEQALVQASFRSTGTVAENSYLNFLPSLRVSVQTGRQSTLSLSYTQGLQRPAIYYLNPYVSIADPLNISFGNPGLLPAKTQVFLVNYQLLVKKTAIHASLTGNYTSRAIQQLSTLGEDKVARTTFENIGSSSQYLLAIGSNIRAGGGFSILLNGDGQYSRFNTGDGSTRDGFSYGLSGGSNFRWRDWRAGAFLGYHAASIRVQGRSDGYVSSNFSVQRLLLKNKRLTIGFSAANPFEKFRRVDTFLEDAAFTQNRSSYTIVRRFQFSVAYRFVRIAP
jgi:hypothetical protein